MAEALAAPGNPARVASRMLPGELMMLRRLGAGSFGEVFEVQELRGGRRFAVKVARGVFSEDGIAPSALCEVCFLKDCRHRNVIKLFEIFQTQDALYLKLELFHMDLHAFLRDPWYLASSIYAWPTPYSLQSTFLAACQAQQTVREDRGPCKPHARCWRTCTTGGSSIGI
mmetsp:Transcript_46013/g.134015  ORF Transcript_46013/g.134015 Transcript_46013/m.134015 type:complete len:170 (-) Transcript_46013:646-1155(-)